MKRWLIRFLLRQLGVRPRSIPEGHGFPIFAVVCPGNRIAEVTMNRHRAVALAREEAAKRDGVALWRYEPVEWERFQ